MSNYVENPLVHRDRRLAKDDSEWVRSFACEDVTPLVVCRGPIRKEALDVFRELGIEHFGILLSDKDSITYSHALAPELRGLGPQNVHHVADYTGATKEEREQRVEQIIQIAKNNGYQYVFAGYGFMAEDENFVRALENAGLTFIGPCSHTVQAAGRKDEAKRTALAEEVSVTPGVNNATALTLLKKHPDKAALAKLVSEKGLSVSAEALESAPLEELADQVLEAGYSKGLDLYSIEELGETVRDEVQKMFVAHPKNRIRLKAIGGGGGKGQRILAAPEAGDTPVAERAAKAAATAPEKLREILLEVKAAGVGDNKNILLELNIEQTRHHEIQLVGNGDWCLTLGGRDCSAQMHEQKLLEVSITDEGLHDAIEAAKQAGNSELVASLEEDRKTLAAMEEQGARFGQAVKLDSVSTFECIVDRGSHYFMEVNTRIQVEHRVSELCYALRFENPEQAGDFFDVHSLVEMMVLLARHGKRLPRPKRVLREGAAVEARLNATDRALQPHAGSTIQSWSDPIEGEVRDDQGISVKNPDTGLFVRYKLAGAYDSNIALLVAVGKDRKDSFERLSEILRLTKLRGADLATNLEFHFGLVHWLLAQNPWAKVTTRFVVPYLTQVGLLAEEARQLDLQSAWQSLHASYRARANTAPEAQRKELLAATDQLFARKATLVPRVLRCLLGEPHFASGWLAVHESDFEVLAQGGLRWRKNPVQVLADTYHFLNMNYREGLPAAQVIWHHDHELLQVALDFYAELEKLTPDEVKSGDFQALEKWLAGDAPSGVDAAKWQSIQGAHRGHQLGLELLGLLPLTAAKVGFWELRVENDLSVTIPERLLDAELQTRMRKVLVPPPENKADELVAVSGGMFYSQEAPGMPALINEGDHFEAGQPLYIIEVMKMFNKVSAPFSGTIDKVLIDNDGTIVRKGQPLFKVTPDERTEEVDPAVVAAEHRRVTEGYLKRLLGS